jgi:hypothetical protein
LNPSTTHLVKMISGFEKATTAYNVGKAIKAPGIWK